MGEEDSIGFFVDGVALFDPTDGFSYANDAEVSPGTGQWHRDAYVGEAITFDPGDSHQQNTGKYHNHADPLALRYSALASYDTGTTTGGISSVSPTSGSRETSIILTITLSSGYNPVPPPNNVQPTAVTLTRTGAATITATSYTRNTSTGVVTASGALPASATAGACTVNATFGPKAGP